MTRKLYKLALWYIRKLHATDRNYRQEVEKMEWLTYKNCGKAHLIYGLGAEWESVGRYEVIDNAIQRLWEYEALGTVEELKEAREKQVAKKVIRQKGECYAMTKDGKEYHEQILLCPNCHRAIKRTEALDVHCKYCGQAIDWETDHLGEATEIVKEGEE